VSGPALRDRPPKPGCAIGGLVVVVACTGNATGVLRPGPLPGTREDAVVNRLAVRGLDPADLRSDASAIRPRPTGPFVTRSRSGLMDARTCEADAATDDDPDASGAACEAGMAALVRTPPPTGAAARTRITETAVARIDMRRRMASPSIRIDPAPNARSPVRAEPTTADRVAHRRDGRRKIDPGVPTRRRPPWRPPWPPPRGSLPCGGAWSFDHCRAARVMRPDRPGPSVGQCHAHGGYSGQPTTGRVSRGSLACDERGTALPAQLMSSKCSNQLELDARRRQSSPRRSRFAWFTGCSTSHAEVATARPRSQRRQASYPGPPPAATAPGPRVGNLKGTRWSTGSPSECFCQARFGDKRAWPDPGNDRIRTNS